MRFPENFVLLEMIYDKEGQNFGLFFFGYEYQNRPENLKLLH